MSPVLELSGVTKRYGDFVAVGDLSFSVQPGEIVGFLGQNGAGKSTTFRMILGIVPPDAGTIRLFGAPSARAVLPRIGYLPEERGLYKRMRADHAIAYFAELQGLGRGEALARARTMLERFGLGEFKNFRIEQLSKGMAQKVQLIATIVHGPDFVMLDEPFSGLDPINQQFLEDIIRDLKREGRTIVFSTHTMQHAERLCDRFVMIAHGRKVFEGTLEEARARLPRRVRIAGEGDPSFLRALPGVVHVQLPAEPGGPIEIELGEGGSPQAVLQAALANGFRLTHFETLSVTLHDAFMMLAGNGAMTEKEAADA